VIRLAVFGSPVSQSLSPDIHRQFAGQCDLLIDYRAIECPLSEFPEMLAQFAAAGGNGCNVTVPLKELAYELADEASPLAKIAQAANTLRLGPGDHSHADNTDGPGLVADLMLDQDLDLSASRICMLGAGGAAAGVLASLLDAQPAKLVVANRAAARARELVTRHQHLGPVSATALSDLSQYGSFDLVINATALGHQGRAPEIPDGLLTPDGLCYDMNYAEAALPLREHCRITGIRYRDGLGMLVAQAALSFELWTGERPETRPVLAHLRPAG
jgi:shikimate dehydrogenase